MKSSEDRNVKFKYKKRNARDDKKTGNYLNLNEKMLRHTYTNANFRDNGNEERSGASRPNDVTDILFARENGDERWWCFFIRFLPKLENQCELL